VVQSSLFNGFSFDPFTYQQDGLTASEVDVGQGQVLQTFVVTAAMVMIDEAIDVRFEVTWWWSGGIKHAPLGHVSLSLSSGRIGAVPRTVEVCQKDMLATHRRWTPESPEMLAFHVSISLTFLYGCRGRRGSVVAASQFLLVPFRGRC
jgi:hypothetical protein